MRKVAVMLLVLLAVSLAAPAAFGQTNPAGGATAPWWIAVSAGFSMAIAAAGCGYAQGKASAAASEGMARNPGASGPITNMLILSLVLIESMALYVFAIIYLKVK